MEEFARFLVLVAFAVLVLNLIQGGPDRVWRWLGAKFLGRDEGAAQVAT